MTRDSTSAGSSAADIDIFHEAGSWWFRLPGEAGAVGPYPSRQAAAGAARRHPHAERRERRIQDATDRAVQQEGDVLGM